MFLPLLCILLYVSAAVLQLVQCYRARPGVFFLMFFAASLAVMVHGYLLYTWIDVAGGQNLTITNMVAQIAWFTSLIVILFLPFSRQLFLGCFAFPFAALSILFSWYFQGSHLVNAGQSALYFLSIILPYFAMAMLCLTLMQALMLALQNYFLKAKGKVGLLLALPPLEQMEKALVRTFKIAYVVVSGCVLVLCLTAIDHGHRLKDFLFFLILWIAMSGLLISSNRYEWQGLQFMRFMVMIVTGFLIGYFLLHSIG